MHDSAAVGIDKLRELEVQEIRALRQAVELELAYRKHMDAQQTFDVIDDFEYNTSLSFFQRIVMNFRRFVSGKHLIS